MTAPALPYYAMRAVPGIPWDAPRDWFVSDVTHMAWRCRTPLRVMAAVSGRLKVAAWAPENAA